MTCKDLPNRKNPFDNHAFTLTELLVVIACVAILAVPLLPAMASTQSKAVVRRSNLQQIGTALMYAGDHQDKFPAAIRPRASFGLEVYLKFRRLADRPADLYGPWAA